jgi:hypothetical protein
VADGNGVQFERLAYEDTRLQAVHAGIYDQSFVQGGLGRGRGINRSANSPLEIWIYGNHAHGSVSCCVRSLGHTVRSGCEFKRLPHLSAMQIFALEHAARVTTPAGP